MVETLKKMVINRGSAQGKLVSLNDAEKEQKEVDKLRKNPVQVPSDMEILLHAIEDKSGITKADKDAARQDIINTKV